MRQLTTDEAKTQLSELIEAALRGEYVVIASDSLHAVQLTPVTHLHGQRQPGTAKGLVTIADDFDAPLADFDEYTQ